MLIPPEPPYAETDLVFDIAATLYDRRHLLSFVLTSACSPKDMNPTFLSMDFDYRLAD